MEPATFVGFFSLKIWHKRSVKMFSAVTFAPLRSGSYRSKRLCLFPQVEEFCGCPYSCHIMAPPVTSCLLPAIPQPPLLLEWSGPLNEIINNLLQKLKFIVGALFGSKKVVELIATKRIPVFYHPLASILVVQFRVGKKEVGWLYWLPSGFFKFQEQAESLWSGSAPFLLFSRVIKAGGSVGKGGASQRLLAGCSLLE